MFCSKDQQHQLLWSDTLGFIDLLQRRGPHTVGSYGASQSKGFALGEVLSGSWGSCDWVSHT